MNNKIVLHIHQKFLPYQGGSTQRLLNLIDNDKSQFKHIVMCINSEGKEIYSKENGLDVYRFNHYWQIPSLMKRILRDNDISIVHLHNYRPAFFGYIGLLLTKNIRTVFELHSVYRPSGFVARLLAKVVHNLTKDMIVLSQSSVSAVRSMNYNKNIHIIRNGIDVNKFEHNSLATSLATKKIVFGYIGSIEKFQGVEQFAELAKLVTNKRSDVEFIVVGGSQKQHFELQKISGNSVSYHHFVPQEVVPQVYKELDVLIMCRPHLPETETAIPLKPLEALASRKLVVSTDVGGMKELSNSLETSNLKLFSDIDSMSQWLISYDKEENHFSDDFNLDKFDKSHNSLLLTQVYKELLDV